MSELQTVGRVRLVADDGTESLPGGAQPKRIALLAYLARVPAAGHETPAKRNAWRPSVIAAIAGSLAVAGVLGAYMNCRTRTPHRRSSRRPGAAADRGGCARGLLVRPLYRDDRDSRLSTPALRNDVIGTRSTYAPATP